jgi:hypothetical protein
VPAKPFDYAFNGDFGKYNPDPSYARVEEPGMSTGVVGDGPAHIPVKGAPAVSNFDVESFMKRLWKPSTKPTFAPTHNFLGAQRQAFAAGRQAPVHARPTNPSVVDVTNPSQNPAYLSGIAKDWKGMLDIKRVNAYAFRGDSRLPTELVRAGFIPPSQRPLDLDYLQKKVFPQFASYLQRRFGKSVAFEDFQQAIAFSGGKAFAELFCQYQIWRGLLQAEEAHIGRMLAQELFKGYISASKSIKVAKGYAAQYASDPSGGWVYCLRIMNGFQIPAKKPDTWTALFGEAEIAHLGAVPGSEIYGFRAVEKSSKKFIGPVYLRSTLVSADNDGAEKIFKFLCGKSQAA